MTTIELILSYASTTLGGGLFATMLTHKKDTQKNVLDDKVDNRKQDENEFKALIDVYQKDNGELKEQLKQNHIDSEQLRAKVMLLSQQLHSMNIKLSIMEASRNNLPIPYWIKDTNLNMLYVNSAFERKFLAPINKVIDDYIGKKDTSIFGVELANQFAITDKMVHDTKQELEFLEPMPTPKGDTIYIHCYKFPRMLGNLVVGIGGLVLGVYDTDEHLKHLLIK